MPAREDQWMCIFSIQVSMKPKKMKNMTLGESDIRQIVHNWGEFGVFESELSDTKCIYMTFSWVFLGSGFSASKFYRLKLAAVQSQKNQTKLVVNLFSLRVKSFLWRWKYRGQQVLKIQHGWKLFTKPSVNTYHCVHSVDNVWRTVCKFIQQINVFLFCCNQTTLANKQPEVIVCSLHWEFATFFLGPRPSQWAFPNARASLRSNKQRFP